MANFSETQKQAAWEKATDVSGADHNQWRKDQFGAWIYKSAYGDTNSAYGWEVDHQFPESLGGNNHQDNLAAMHFQNNRSKANNFPEFEGVITSKGNENITTNQKRYFKPEFIERLKEIHPGNAFLTKLPK